MEQMLAVFAAFYSKNLSTETKRGKRQRALNGDFNGSTPPIGYDLVTVANALPERPVGLYINLRLAALVRRAFRLYSTGNYSDAQIATWLNQHRAVQKLRQGRKPVDKEMVRELLQNRVYTGRVRYTDTIYKGKLGERRASRRHRGEWFEGKHEGFITDDLFDLCQQVRAGLVRHRNAPSTERIYVLHDRVYCARCTMNKPLGLVDDNFGRMRPKFQNQRGYAYYRCMSRDRGYDKCGQPAVAVPDIDQQVVDILANMVIPPGFRERVEAAINARVENDAALKRMEEIQEIVERIDFRWEQGFIDKDEYVKKRTELQQQLNALRPIQYDELIEAADLIANFRHYWDNCAQVEQPDVARQQLITKIVERIFVHETEVVALVLYGDFAVILGENEIASNLVADAISSNLVSDQLATLQSSHFGADGI